MPAYSVGASCFFNTIGYPKTSTDKGNKGIPTFFLCNQFMYEI